MKVVTAHPYALLMGWKSLNERKGDTTISEMRQTRRIKEAITEKTGPVQEVLNPYSINVTPRNQLAVMAQRFAASGIGEDVLEHVSRAFDALRDEKYDKHEIELEPDKRVSVKMIPDDWKFLKEQIEKHSKKGGYEGSDVEATLDLLDAIEEGQHEAKIDRHPDADNGTDSREDATPESGEE